MSSVVKEQLFRVILCISSYILWPSVLMDFWWCCVVASQLVAWSRRSPQHRKTFKVTGLLARNNYLVSIKADPTLCKWKVHSWRKNADNIAIMCYLCTATPITLHHPLNTRCRTVVSNWRRRSLQTFSQQAPAYLVSSSLTPASLLTCSTVASAPASWTGSVSAINLWCYCHFEGWLHL